jgi:predicted DNA-binding mobile mystery protein A
MHVSRQAISQLEARELEGSASLQALEEAAQALGGKLVYAIVPNQALGETLRQRAEELATRWTSEVRHTMKLEDQEPETELDRPMGELVQELLASPSRLWEET